MAGIVAFPEVVQQALRDFGDLFANEPQRRHFGEYLTGLYVAARKTITGINAEFAQTTDQSCLNASPTTTPGTCRRSTRGVCGCCSVMPTPATASTAPSPWTTR